MKWNANVPDGLVTDGLKHIINEIISSLMLFIYSSDFRREWMSEALAKTTEMSRSRKERDLAIGVWLGDRDFGGGGLALRPREREHEVVDGLWLDASGLAIRDADKVWRKRVTVAWTKPGVIR